MQLDFNQILSNISQSTDLPLLAASALGLLVALNPCQLAICVSALTYEYRQGKTFADIIMYTLGRTATYTLLGWITMCLIGGGKNIVPMQNVLSLAEKGVPFLLILIGIFLLIRGFHRHQHNGETCHNSGKIIKRNAKLLAETLFDLRLISDALCQPGLPAAQQVDGDEDGSPQRQGTD